MTPLSWHVPIGSELGFGSLYAANLRHVGLVHGVSTGVVYVPPIGEQDVNNQKCAVVVDPASTVTQNLKTMVIIPVVHDRR